MFVRSLLIVLLGTKFSAALTPTTLDSTLEIDLVFPLNETYAPLSSFPVIFVLQDISVAWQFGFNFLWNITGYPDDEDGARAIWGPGSVFVFRGENLPAPSDPYIIVNSTDFKGLGIPSGNTQLPPGTWVLGKCESPGALYLILSWLANCCFLTVPWGHTAPQRRSQAWILNFRSDTDTRFQLGWSYGSTTCTQDGTTLDIEGQTAAQGSIAFTVKEGGALPVFTENCPTLAGLAHYYANFSGCPSIDSTGSSNPCGAKINDAQASSISSVLALETAAPTSSGTGNTQGGGGSTLTAGGSSPSASSNSKSPNFAGREQPRFWQLGGVGLLVAFRALLL